MERQEILAELWAEQDKAFELMTEYDRLPHHYGSDVLYQAEAYALHEIGNKPGITASELADKLNNTRGAASQMVKKLIEKRLVIQTRNETNRRIYHLTLTDDGKKVYKDHIEFNKSCQKTTFDLLSEFTDEELKIHAKVQRIINISYQGDVERSKEKWD